MPFGPTKLFSSPGRKEGIFHKYELYLKSHIEMLKDSSTIERNKHFSRPAVQMDIAQSPNASCDLFKIFTQIQQLGNQTNDTLNIDRCKTTAFKDIERNLLDMSKKLHDKEKTGIRPLLRKSVARIVDEHEDFLWMLSEMRLRRDVMQDVDTLLHKLREISESDLPSDDIEKESKFVVDMESVIALLWQIARKMTAVEEKHSDSTPTLESAPWRRLASNARESHSTDPILNLFMNDDFQTGRTVWPHDMLKKKSEQLEASWCRSLGVGTATAPRYGSTLANADGWPPVDEDIEPGARGLCSDPHLSISAPTINESDSGPLQYPSGLYELSPSSTSQASEQSGGEPYRSTAYKTTTRVSKTGPILQEHSYSRASQCSPAQTDESETSSTGAGLPRSDFDEDISSHPSTIIAELSSSSCSYSSLETDTSFQSEDSSTNDTAADKQAGEVASVATGQWDLCTELCNDCWSNGYLRPDGAGEDCEHVPAHPGEVLRQETSTPMRGGSLGSGLEQGYEYAVAYTPPKSHVIEGGRHRFCSCNGSRDCECDSRNISIERGKVHSKELTGLNTIIDFEIDDSYFSCATSKPLAADNLDPEAEIDLVPCNSLFSGGSPKQETSLPWLGHASRDRPASQSSTDEESIKSNITLSTSLDSISSFYSDKHGPHDCDEGVECTKLMTTDEHLPPGPPPGAESASLARDGVSCQCHHVTECRRLLSPIKTLQHPMQKQRWAAMSNASESNARGPRIQLATLLLAASVVMLLAVICLHIKCSGIVEIVEYYSLWEILQKHIVVTKVGKSFF